MNERNVEALFRLLVQEINANGYVDVDRMEATRILDADPDFPPYAGAVKRLRDLCEFFSSHGVLIPSALTDDEAITVHPGDGFLTLRQAGDEVRRTLTEIAKGE